MDIINPMWSRDSDLVEESVLDEKQVSRQRRTRARNHAPLLTPEEQQSHNTQGDCSDERSYRNSRCLKP